jgi:DNA-binding NtrC family response regulator
VDKSEFIILIAEDDRIVQDVIVNFLTEEGYPVRVANDGLAALELLRLEDIKLVLTDLRMPGADGMEVLRSAIQINPRIAVVLLTAYGTLDTALEAMKEGAYDYIVKPFVMQQLLLVVRNAYKMASLIKENEKLTHQLKETYRNLETVRKISSQERKNVTDNSMESIETLKEQKVIDPNEAMMLKERLATGTVNENIKKYSSLVNDLKNK